MQSLLIPDDLFSVFMTFLDSEVRHLRPHFEKSQATKELMAWLDQVVQRYKKGEWVAHKVFNIERLGDELRHKRDVRLGKAMPTKRGRPKSVLGHPERFVGPCESKRWRGHKLLGCPKYRECLEIAENRRWPSFTCDRCKLAENKS